MVVPSLSSPTGRLPWAWQSRAGCKEVGRPPRYAGIRHHHVQVERQSLRVRLIERRKRGSRGFAPAGRKGLQREACGERRRCPARQCCCGDWGWPVDIPLQLLMLCCCSGLPWLPALVGRLLVAALHIPPGPPRVPERGLQLWRGRLLLLPARGSAARRSRDVRRPLEFRPRGEGDRVQAGKSGAR